MDGMQFERLFREGLGTVVIDIKTRLESSECKQLLLAEINKAIPDDKRWLGMSFEFDAQTFANNIRDTQLTMGTSDWMEGGKIQFVFRFENTTIGISKTISLYYVMTGPPPPM
jgi:hypothetical protein